MTGKPFDVLIIGSGGAGLSLALKLADHSVNVAVLSKFALTAGSTYYAQGGISAVFDAEDSIESHIEDTLNAGAGLCEPEIVKLAVTYGKNSINWLREQGVVFTEETVITGETKLHLTREGGHSHRRVVHAADATGKAVSLSLIERAMEHSNITLFEHYNVVELITTKTSANPNKAAIGAYVLDSKKQQVNAMSARVVVLATGGASKV
ncbi:MAG: FAD-dependent oxidoreductase, partial [Methyloglobulus sp.]|nr:FAD-dependent oxidoreductase [Methyloglobulus sp.]